MSNEEQEIDRLVRDLPEQYQQIFSYPKYDNTSSRNCKQRLEHILTVYERLKALYGRELKVLDLGCAQGYYSFEIAKRGGIVNGIDNCEKNVKLCRKIAQFQNELKITFIKNNIQHYLMSIDYAEYDLVLGLSVLHHLCYEDGFESTKFMVTSIADKIPNAIFELALNSEPIYWSKSLNYDSKEILDGFPFIHLISKVKNHLSNIERPIYFASNNIFLTESLVSKFIHASTSPHKFEDKAHNNTRRYYFTNDSIIKYISFDDQTNRNANKKEFINEVQFLESNVSIKNKPEILHHYSDNNYGVIHRGIAKGKLLYKKLNKLQFDDKEKIVLDILSQLILLENSGLYHDDLRVWNIIMNDSGDVTLIDYGAISSKNHDCLWPSNTFYSFIILVVEIFSGDYLHHNPTRKLDISNFKHLKYLRSPIIQILQCDTKCLSFSSIQKILQLSKSKDDNNDFDLFFYEQNNSLNLHIKKLKQAEEVLTNIVQSKKDESLHIDFLLHQIQIIYSKKNELINSFEKENHHLNNIISDLNLEIENLKVSITEKVVENNSLINSNKLLKDDISKLEIIVNILNGKIYKVNFLKHIYRAWQRLSGAKRYN